MEEAGAERRGRSFVEEIDASKCRLFCEHHPASGKAGADDDLPYTGLTSGLARSQDLVKKATPPFCSRTQGPFSIMPLEDDWAACPPIPRLHRPQGNDRPWESERQCCPSSRSAAPLAQRSWVVQEAAQLPATC